MTQNHPKFSIPAPLQAQAEALSIALGESPELVLRLALRVGLAALPERLGLFPETLERAQQALTRRKRSGQSSAMAEPDAPAEGQWSEPPQDTNEDPLTFAQILNATQQAPPSRPTWEDPPAAWSLAEAPSLDKLRDMIAMLDDEAGHHILWVDYTGGVRATCLEPGQAPALWIRAHEEKVLLMETYSMGNGYVGPEAAKDDTWMNKLYHNLTSQWDMVADALRSK